jgi:hypothetical protein
MKMDISLFSLVETDQDALMMEAASISETSVNFYQTTRRNIPEDSDIQVLSKTKESQKNESH